MRKACQGVLPTPKRGADDPVFVENHYTYGGSHMKRSKKPIVFLLVLCTLFSSFSFSVAAAEPTGMTVSQLAAASGDVATNLTAIIQSGAVDDNGVYYNISTPSYITVGAYEMGIEDYVIMAGRAIYQLALGNSASSTNVPYANRILNTATCTEAGTGTLLTKAQYLELAERISKLGTTSAKLPSSFNRPTDGVNSYNGRICVFSIAQAFAKVLQGYASAGTLLSAVEFLPTNYTTSETYTPSRDWYNDVLTAAVTVADYVEKNKKLPTSVTILGTSVNMSQFAVLELQVLIGLSQGKSNDVLSYPNVTACANPSESLTSGQIQKANYITYATNIVNYVKNNGNTIPNYVTTSLGTMRFENFTYSYAKILRWYRQNSNTLPTYVTVSPWSSVTAASSGSSSGTTTGTTTKFSWENENIPAQIYNPESNYKKNVSSANYLKRTKFCQSTNSTIISKAKYGILTWSGRKYSNPKNFYQAAYNLEKYLNNYTSYEYYTCTIKGALNTWNAKKGNCGDFSHMGNAFARAAHIPAMYIHHEGHFWSKWWCGSSYGWKIVDLCNNSDYLGYTVYASKYPTVRTCCNGYYQMAHENGSIWSSANKN